MAKPNLLLIHGALGSKAQFQKLGEALKAHFTIYSFNLSGHGGENLGYSFDMDGFSAQILDFLEMKSIKEANVFGYSMGGYAAITAALKAPEKFNKIATLGTKFRWSPEIAAKEVRMLDADKIQEKVPAFAQVLEKRHAPLPWKKVLSDTAQMMHGLGSGKGLKQEALAGLQTQIFISLGTEDNMVSHDESMEVVRTLPRATFQSYQNFPHPIEKIDYSILAETLTEQFIRN